jgi:uncharacterized protein (TIGR02246 family)
MEKIRNAINSANQQFMNAFSRGDAAAIAALYTEDAKLLPPDNQMMSGTEAIKAFWEGAMSMGIKEVMLDTIDVEARDDLAYEVGKATLTIQPSGAQSMTVTAKYLVVWKNQAGDWKLHVDIWNANASA